MIEVEVKLRVNNLQDVEAGLAEQGFHTEKVLQETDIYFDSDAGRIRTGGQALRVRKIVNCESGEELSVMTFKGAKIDTVSMARQELETTVGSGDVAVGILNAIGYHPVEPRVVKTRRLMLCRDVCACLDNVEGLGTFLELEVMAEDEAGRPEALEKIEKLLGCLGYTMRDTTRRSYLSQLQGAAEL